MPFALEAMLNKYRYPTTVRAIAIGLAVLTGLQTTRINFLPEDKRERQLMES